MQFNEDIVGLVYNTLKTKTKIKTDATFVYFIMKFPVLNTEINIKMKKDTFKKIRDYFNQIEV